MLKTCYEFTQIECCYGIGRCFAPNQECIAFTPKSSIMGGLGLAVALDAFGLQCSGCNYLIKCDCKDIRAK